MNRTANTEDDDDDEKKKRTNVVRQIYQASVYVSFEFTLLNGRQFNIEKSIAAVSVVCGTVCLCGVCACECMRFIGGSFCHSAHTKADIIID